MRIALTADEFYPAIRGSPTSVTELSTVLIKFGADPGRSYPRPGQLAEEET